MANSAYPDQLASSEAKAGHIPVQQDKLTHKTFITAAADNILIFYIFKRNKDLTFHVNGLLSRLFT